MKRALLVACCLLAVTGRAAPAGGLRWTLVRHQIAREFPHVPQLSTTELAEWRADASRKQPLLLDVRTPAEYAVSHLPGARQIAPDATAAQLGAGVRKDQPIVTYCSVGYRSSAFAERLRAAGYTEVRNLAGSIFQWANEDRALVRDGEPATVVHPYSTAWSGLLKQERRAPMK